VNTTTCQFCGESDFDLVGLKSHLLNYCEQFSETPDAQQCIMERIAEIKAKQQEDKR
jgi:hypothetical protein